MYLLWIASFLLELFIYSVTLRSRFNKILAMFVIVAVITTTTLLFSFFPLWVWLLLVVFGIFRIINLLRVVKSRMHTMYLQKAVFRSMFVIIIYHYSLFIFSMIVSSLGNHIWVLVQMFSLLVAILLLISLMLNLRKLRYKPAKTFLADSELPTVTVAIPARNETADLEDCLQSIIASDYPKLEIIVLDDCSQDKTAEIIRSFAHDGVRFVQGSPPPKRWLAKNHAYQRLLEESSGQLVLFCGVDIRFGVNSLRNIVNLMNSKDKNMLSILPSRESSEPSSTFIQPMRYWWELVPPRRLFNRPPVLSSCWIASSRRLNELGGFKSVSHAVIPEGYFARELVKNDEYSFVKSNHDLAIHTAKNLQDQEETAIRTQYPLIRRRPENALFLTIINAVLFIGPFYLLILDIVGSASLNYIALFNCLILVAIHLIIVGLTNPGNLTTAIFNFPIAVLVETFTGYISMFKYEFGTVEWKERNICIPVMHTIQRQQK